MLVCQYSWTVEEHELFSSFKFLRNSWGLFINLELKLWITNLSAPDFLFLHNPVQQMALSTVLYPALIVLVSLANSSHLLALWSFYWIQKSQPWTNPTVISGLLYIAEESLKSGLKGFPDPFPMYVCVSVSTLTRNFWTPVGWHSFK